jgi:hypothetical protein
MFPYQLVCEGKADEVFFSRLLKASGKNVDVRCPEKDDPNGGLGKNAIHKTLNGIKAQFDKISRVVVLVDSDNNPAQALTDAQEEFNKANNKNPAKLYPVPVVANAISTLEGSPDTAIVLVPGAGMHGCLDSLLLPSFEQVYPGKPLECTNDFCNCLKNPERG